jgi:hypothetical protein
MEHHLNNQLFVTVGFCEVLAKSPRLPEDLRGQAERALEGAEAAARTLAELQRLSRLDEDPGLRGPPVIDLGRPPEGESPLGPPR